jgi:hypothetical protein
MSQATLATKTALTVTGTAGPNWTAAGRDTKGVLGWRDLTASNPLAQDVFTQQAGLVPDGSAWKSTTILKVPVMESIAADGSSSGYLAADKVAYYDYYEIRATRNGRSTATIAGNSLDKLLSAIANNPSIRTGIIGFVNADA